MKSMTEGATGCFSLHRITGEERDELKNELFNLKEKGFAELNNKTK